MNIYMLFHTMIVIPMADKVPEGWRNIGPKWNFPFADLLKTVLGWGFAIAAVAGVVIALLSVITAVALTLRGKEGAGTAWFAFALGLLLIGIGLGGSSLMFDMANLVKLKA